MDFLYLIFLSLFLFLEAEGKGGGGGKDNSNASKSEIIFVFVTVCVFFLAVLIAYCIWWKCCQKNETQVETEARLEDHEKPVSRMTKIRAWMGRQWLDFIDLKKSIQYLKIQHKIHMTYFWCFYSYLLVVLIKQIHTCITVRHAFILNWSTKRNTQYQIQI